MRTRSIRVLALAAALALMMTATAFGASKKVVLHVPDMCASNEVQAQAVLEEIDGVTTVETDLGETTVTVSFDDEKAGVDAFKGALEGISLMVESVEDAD